MSDFDFTYLSYGAGVQSSALLVCSALGLAGVPRVDVAIFADTGDEPPWVYETLELMKLWARERGITIESVSAGCLSADVQARHDGTKKRFVCIPAFTQGSDGRASILRRQCTREYKIDPITKKVRQLLGYEPRQRVKHRVRCLVGISLDEAQRMKPSRFKWVTNVFPLVFGGLRRRDCELLVSRQGLPVPKKSSCVFCPFHSDGFWLALRDNHPEEFERAVVFDRVIRDMSMSGLKRPAFLHRSLQPLDAVDFDLNRDQVDMFGNECEGHCGI
jgi:hypothetical protein